MEKIIHITVRDPQNLSTTQAEIVERARTLHPQWEIRIWGDPTPAMLAHGFLLHRYWSRARSGAQLADLLRLDILYKFGGIYVDSDLKLHKPLDEIGKEFDFFVASEDGDHIT